jgi:hypothetical protein
VFSLISSKVRRFPELLDLDVGIAVDTVFSPAVFRPAVQASASGLDRGGGDEAEGALRLLFRFPCCRPGLGQVAHGLI